MCQKPFVASKLADPKSIQPSWARLLLNAYATRLLVSVTKNWTLVAVVVARLLLPFQAATVKLTACAVPFETMLNFKAVVGGAVCRTARFVMK